MAQRYLLDTNFLSVLVRTPAALAKKIAAVGEANVCTSIVVACELRFGAEKKRSAQLTRRVDQLLDVLDVLPLDGDVDRHYAAVRQQLEMKGKPIGGNDLLIAAQALQHGCVLVTQNRREFQRVAGLRVEAWL
jgi:tRNA(fMet)-specific endonuclease VapC